MAVKPRPGRKRVLILCTGNSCRSQMAAAWINHLLGDDWEALSAGTAPATRVHPLAVRVMAEVGVDISDHVPQHVERFVGQPWDLVVTVCDSAAEACPTFPGRVARMHVSFTDPAAATGTAPEQLAVFRRVRDEIRERLLPAIQDKAQSAQTVDGRGDS